jgi:hypothetical protein
MVKRMGRVSFKKTKKIFLLFFIFLILSINFSFIVDSKGISVSPSRLYIKINDFKNESVNYSITVYNPNKYPINVVTKIKHPDQGSGLEDYSVIPDLSWIKTDPVNFSIPAKKSKCFDVFIDVPEKKRSQYFNESWEVWVTSSSYGGSDGGMVTLETALNTRILITMPDGSAESVEAGSSNVFVAFALISGLISAVILFFYLRKKT